MDQAEAINSPALFSNVTGNNCTVIACVRMLNRLFDYRWVNSDSCLLNGEWAIDYLVRHYVWPLITIMV